MLINVSLLTTSGKQHFLIQERWPGQDATTDYVGQAQTLRRALDSVEHFEKVFNEGNVVGFAHKGISYQCVFTLACVDTIEQLDSFIVDNAPHTRVGADFRRIMPLVPWDSGRANLVSVLHRLEELAAEERDSVQRRDIRPVRHDRDRAEVDR
jgi:hypothetical protein